MKRNKPLLLVLGIGLILASLCLMLFYGLRMHIGTKRGREILTQMTALLPERTQSAGEAYPDSRMPVLSLDGTDYVAMLEIPAFGVTLPVADQWDSKNLYCAPSRFSGSAYDQMLVIGGADTPGQFSFCDQIDNGAVITVTDMTGVQFTYTVSRVDRAKHAESQWLMSADYDLTLFCHDFYSMEYIAVRCLLSYS